MSAILVPLYLFVRTEKQCKCEQAPRLLVTQIWLILALSSSCSHFIVLDQSQAKEAGLALIIIFTTN